MECPVCHYRLKCHLHIETERINLPVIISYQWWSCKKCKTKYFGLLEESKVNIFDDRLEHQGFYAEEIYWNESLKRSKKCPDPKNSACQCKIHLEISKLEFHGKSAWYSYE